MDWSIRACACLEQRDRQAIEKVRVCTLYHGPMYLCQERCGWPLILSFLYVNDILYGYHDKTAMWAVHDSLAKIWNVRWMSDAEKFLGLRITRDRGRNTIHLSQRKFIQEALSMSNMTYCNPCQIPVDTTSKLRNATAEDTLLLSSKNNCTTPLSAN